MIDVVLLGLVRNHAGLSAWISELAADTGIPQTRRISLSALPEALYRQRDHLLADWNSLAEVRDLASAWPAFWRVLWATQADSGTPPARRADASPPQRPVATAAHPRAFRGTKYQPPKPATSTLALHALLSDVRLLDDFFARHDFALLPVRAEDGHAQIDSAKVQLPPTSARLLAAASGNAEGTPSQFTDAFRRDFLWTLRTHPVAETHVWLQHWHALGCGQEARRHALLAHLCALAPCSHGWAELALHLAVEHQPIFLAAVLQRRADLLPSTVLTREQLARISADTDDTQQFARLLDLVLDNLNRRVSTAYTLDGYTLARSLAGPMDEERFNRLRTGDDALHVPLNDIVRMRSALGENGDHWVLSAWSYCGRLPGFERVLRETGWEHLTPVAADLWLALFVQIVWNESDEQKIQAHWRACLALFADWHGALSALSGPWQEKFVRILRDYTEDWDDPDTLRVSVAHLLPLLGRLCKPPFSATAYGAGALTAMARSLQETGWQLLANLDERTWLRAERACRRDNDAHLLYRGLYTLAQCWPAFALHALRHAPLPLFRVATLLGCLAYDRRKQFLSELRHAVWFATDWHALPALEAGERLFRLCIEHGVNSPVPRRLRDHVEGRLSLSTAQIERHGRVSLARLPVVQLAALEQAIWQAIDTHFQLAEHSRPARHALRLLAGLGKRDNRNGLRRVLNALSQGQAPAYLDHPLNLAWQARHPRIDQQQWRTRQQRERIDGVGEVLLAIETNPLEILMLGTYVGSCLGLGGLCDYSAVACLLDANKQVVYARDAAGRVLARQLLAIDERERLVRFAVYPATASQPLQAAFGAFTEKLAGALGVELYRQREGDNYDISIILAQTWWDDGAADM